MGLDMRYGNTEQAMGFAVGFNKDGGVLSTSRFVNTITLPSGNLSAGSTGMAICVFRTGPDG